MPSDIFGSNDGYGSISRNSEGRECGKLNLTAIKLYYNLLRRTRLFYLTVKDDVVRVMARMESDDGTVGEFYREIKEGENLCGVSYEDLLAHGSGEMEIEAK